PRHDHLRPARDRHERAQADDRGAVPADREALAPGDSVAVPAAPEPGHGGRAVRDALDQAHRHRRRAEPRGDEQRQDGEDHLVVRVRGEVGDADADDVPIQPPGSEGPARAGGAQTVSKGSGRNGPPSLSATKALASTGSPLATETITYT